MSRRALAVAFAWMLGVAAQPALADAPPGASASPAPAAQPAPRSAPQPPRADTRGVVVITAGDVAYADGPAGRVYTAGERAHGSATSLARAVYGDRDLTPSLTENEVAVLVGRPADAGATDRGPRLGALRASLRAPVDDVAARAILFQIGAATGARALLVVVDDGAAVTARLVRIEGSDAIVDAVQLAPKDQPTALDWSAAVPSVRALVGPAPEPTAPKAKPKPKPAPPPPPPPVEEESTQFYESPWFWVALGSATAIGVTALVVSQTVDTDSGSIHLTGKMPLSFSF